MFFIKGYIIRKNMKRFSKLLLMIIGMTIYNTAFSAAQAEELDDFVAFNNQKKELKQELKNLRKDLHTKKIRSIGYRLLEEKIISKDLALIKIEEILPQLKMAYVQRLTKDKNLYEKNLSSLQKNITRVKTELDKIHQIPMEKRKQLPAEERSALGEKEDELDKKNAEYSNQKNRLEANREKVMNLLSQLNYPEDVTQLNIADQKNNDCGFRSVRNAILAYLWGTKQLSDKDFNNAVEKNDKAIISIDDLKKSNGPDGKPLSSLRGNDFQTSIEEIQKIINKAVQLGNFKVGSQNISILSPLLRFQTTDLDSVPIFFEWINSESIKAVINSFREKQNFAHAFVINSDEGREGQPPRVTHWVAILVEKINGAYSYTILDSLNKERLLLQQNLAYLIENFTGFGIGSVKKEDEEKKE